MKAGNKNKIAAKRVSSHPEMAQNNISYEILGIAVITLASLGAASFFTTALGAVGSLLGRGMEVIAGENRYLIILSMVLLGIKLIREKSKFKMTPRAVGFSILVLVLLTFAHMDIPLGDLMDQGYKGAGGGIVGATTVYAATSCFGTVGTYIVLASLTLVSLILITGYTLAQLGLLATLRAKKAGSGVWRWVLNYLTEEVRAEEQDEDDCRTVLLKEKNTDTERPLIPSQAAEKSQDPSEELKNKKKNTKSRVEVADIPPMPLADGRIYRLPPVNLLKLTEKANNEVSDRELAERARTLESTLESFSIQAKVVGVSLGPAITRYEIQPPPGIKVSRIVGLADDIALNLAAPGVRIEAPIPGKAAVGIEVPNREISPVTLRELIESKEFKNSPSKLSVALGKDIAGTPIVADLGKMPHLLVAGATGAGKSVCINTIISSILFKATPDEVKLLMVDPKMVELTNYNGIPHLISPVVTDSKKAAGTLRWAVKEMERRYELFASTGVRDIERYNTTCNNSPGEDRQKLPFVVIIIDELADLMMVAPADVEDSICRLAQMARAAGIHLLIATQRPSVDVITGLIKANIPSRISFAVSSLVDSRTILDMGGAEKLLGRGDMLFLPVGAAKPVRVQGAYLSDQEVEGLVTYLKEQAQPVYDEQVLTAPPASDTSSNSDDDYDELLVQAVKIFIESGTASISLLQRRLHIGYARAARLVDIMERRGIVGGFEGSKPRNIRMTLEQFEQTFKDQL
ncbi:MAG: DNA translocase FtsK 4TM domain-containing protein [Bacillota bacterium]